MYKLKDFLTFKMNKVFVLEFDKQIDFNIGDTIKSISKYKVIDVNVFSCVVEAIGKYNFRDFKIGNNFNKIE